MKIGDTIRIRPIHVSGLNTDTINKHGDMYLIKKMTNLRIAKCHEIDVISIKTGASFCLTEKYYEIEVFPEYEDVELPLELFEL